MLDGDGEVVFLDTRRHGVVLARPFLKAAAAAALGVVALAAGWPVSAAGAAMLVVAAIGAAAAVWRWERTHVVVTTEKLFVVHGVLRRRAAAVRLARVGSIELEQGVLGRLLGYGTICAGDLEISYVADPREVCRLVQRLAA